ncbi:MAG: PAS domain S-box protein [Thermodesulfobacteriota bacterium]|nr:PAS domain S-box protein [Thermodesulfobacteriota bacterium]
MNEKNILIADDDETIRSTLTQILHEHGFTVLLASNGKEAVEVTRNNPVDMAILDIKMPIMDGINALRKIKEFDQNIEVLIMTGWANLESLKQAMVNYGALDYILKPFSYTEIVHSVSRALFKRDFILQREIAENEPDNRILELEKDLYGKTRQLRESQIKYKEIIENSNDGIIVVQDGMSKFMNPKILEMTYYTEQEILDIPFNKIIHPEDFTMVMEMHTRLLHNEDVPTISIFRALTKNGKCTWVENNAVRTIWEGRPAVLNFLRDISERKRIEEALWESQKQYWELYEHAKEYYVLIDDRTGRLRQPNREMLRVMGYSREELEQLHFIEIVDHEDREKVENARRMKLKEKDGASITYNCWVRTKKGEKRLLNVTELQLTSIRGTFLSAIDLTELEKMKELMTRSEKLSSLGQLAAGLAHELRNPLAVISSCSQFCLDGMDLTRLLSENLQMIYRSSQRANKLIQNLLEFARPSSLEWKNVDINQVITKTWNIAKIHMPPVHISFVEQLDENLPKIVGDNEKLSQVFLNLFLNAIQAISNEGVIGVHTHFLSEKNMVEVEIIDNGSGIPEDYRHMIFDPFFTTKDKGIGLGLSICHSIVEQHNGTITMESKSQCGTTVSVGLPAVQG